MATMCLSFLRLARCSILSRFDLAMLGTTFEKLQQWLVKLFWGMQCLSFAGTSDYSMLILNLTRMSVLVLYSPLIQWDSPPIQRNYVLISCGGWFAYCLKAFFPCLCYIWWSVDVGFWKRDLSQYKISCRELACWLWKSIEIILNKLCLFGAFLCAVCSSRF